MTLFDRVTNLVYGVPETRSTNVETRALQPALNAPYPSGTVRANQNFDRLDFNNQNYTDALIKKYYMMSLWTYRGLNTIANSIGRLPWRVGSNPAKPESFNTYAPMAKILGPEPGSPNPEMSSGAFWRHSIIQYHFGGFAWAKERDPNTGLVIAYWPLQIQNFKPIYEDRPGRANYFKWYEYGTGYNKRIYRPEDVVYVYRPAQDDPRRRESIFEAAGLVIDTTIMLYMADYGLMARGGAPGSIVETPAFASQEQYDAFKADFIAMFTGARNTGRNMFVERNVSSGDGAAPVAGVSIHPIGYSPKDLLMTDQKEIGRTEVLAALGVPPGMVGIHGDVTYENGMWERKNYWRDTCMPLIDEITDGVNAQTRNDFIRPQTGWFDISTVEELQPEPLMNAQEGLAALSQGAITQDEFRGLVGLEPMEQEAVTVAPVNTPDDSNIIDAEVVPNALPAPATNFLAARAERRAKVLFATPGACDICKSFDGKGRGRYKYILPHPNCKCDVETVRARKYLLRAMDVQEELLEEEIRRAIDSIRDGSRGGKLQAEFRSNPLSVVDMDKWTRRSDEVFRGNLLQLGHEDDYEGVASEILDVILDNLSSEGLFTVEEGQTNA